MPNTLLGNDKLPHTTEVKKLQWINDKNREENQTERQAVVKRASAPWNLDERERPATGRSGEVRSVHPESPRRKARGGGRLRVSSQRRRRRAVGSGDLGQGHSRSRASQEGKPRGFN